MENTTIQFTIDKVPVTFPYKPYGTQMAMMYRIINSLNNKQNCLLELPTGSGKTMALLCGTLSWFDNNNKLLEITEKIDKTHNSSRPKIYFGTRTHKQISQVVRELKKSPYSKTQMSIISGRKQACINKDILSSSDIDQSCKDLCKSQEGCYFGKIKEEPRPVEPWDIEFVKKDLRKKKACPYYNMKHWLKSANIVLCPYNYILNPFIRKSMQIDLEGAIVILDEAHNVEDICRDGFSISISQEELDMCYIQLLVTLKNLRVSRNTLNLPDMVTNITKMIHVLSAKLLFKDEDVLKKTWDVEDFITLLKKYNLDLKQIHQFKSSLKNLQEAIKRNEEEKENDFEDDKDNSSVKRSTGKRSPGISSQSINVMEMFIIIAEMLLNESREFEKDFSIIITEGESYIPVKTEQQTDLDGVWLTSKRKSSELKTNFILNMWCMNPGIAFREMSKNTHSIILTSGTLSPIRSFENELSCQFPLVLEAHHVVGIDQTFIANIGRGPTGKELHAVYKNTNTTDFQDELGRLIISCCEIVPNGILCFLSSFFLLDTLIKRWTKTSMIRDIAQHKQILVEPRNNNEMNDVMNEFYKNVSTGALLFAVYRGKASEGMDFSDEAARLVITVGIPYPSVNDPKVILKKNYNTAKHREMKNSKENTCLSGQEWYNIVAFRALNQAIGRCIRHRDDWGAMIMVDTRFGDSSSGYSNGLCKWIRGRQQQYSHWSNLYNNLKLFMTSHQKEIEPILRE